MDDLTCTLVLVAQSCDFLVEDVLSTTLYPVLRKLGLYSGTSELINTMHGLLVGPLGTVQ